MVVLDHGGLEADGVDVASDERDDRIGSPLDPNSVAEHDRVWVASVDSGPGLDIIRFYNLWEELVIVCHYGWEGRVGHATQVERSPRGTIGYWPFVDFTHGSQVVRISTLNEGGVLQSTGAMRRKASECRHPIASELLLRSPDVKCRGIRVNVA